MTKLYDAEIKQILEHYGNDHQIVKAVEELAELQVVLLHNAGRVRILEELTDVVVMLEQIKEIYNISDTDINVEMAYKIARQQSRMKKETKDNGQ